MMFGPSGFPDPNAAVAARKWTRMNAAMKALLVQQDPSLKEVFEQHPAWEPFEGDAVHSFRS